MPSRVPGNSSCTAWASTCAVECRMTARPSALAAGDRLHLGVGVRGPVQVLEVAGATSRTTTAPSGPLSGTPASLSACIAVVPAGTRSGAAAVGRGRGRTQELLEGLGERGPPSLVRGSGSARDDVQPGGHGAAAVEHRGDAVEGRRVGRARTGRASAPHSICSGTASAAVDREPAVGAAGEGEPGRRPSPRSPCRGSSARR